MRYVVARRIGKRGEGLGNEMLAWAKGFLASQALTAKLVGPSWGLNKRKYYRNFRTSRFDFMLEELLTRMDSYAFTEQDYNDSGQIHFGRAIEVWARQRGLLGKKSYVVTVDGMYGGYAAIHEARWFLLSKLLGSKDALSNMHQISARLDPLKLFVAVHMRLGGDFDKLREDESARGRFNIQLPLSWYAQVCESLQRTFRNHIQFYFFSDRVTTESKNVVERFNPGQLRQPGLTECSDLALMAEADLRICSVSSYSLAASFLARGPFIWYEPQLAYEDGCYSIWGHEASQRLTGSLTMQALSDIRDLPIASDQQEYFRGYPVRVDGLLPGGLLSQLDRILRGKNRSRNLLEYGAVPGWVVTAKDSASPASDEACVHL